MAEPLEPHEVREVEALRVLAHPMRQRILRYLRRAGPATSTSLATDLGENSGIMSYHLRQLAEHGFVQEVAGRGQGRERWWQAAPGPLWIPREGLSLEARAEASGMRPPDLAGDLEGFERFRAARGAMGEWGRGTWALLRTTLTLTREEAARLIAEQQEMIGRYRRGPGDAPAGARAVVFAFLVYPQPPPEGTQGPAGPAGPGI
jgi:DNA-binding transcriptional ArsR family regulator